MPSLQTTVGYETGAMTISDSAIAIDNAGWSWTAGNLAKAERASITAWTHPVAMTYDGTTPTATTGRSIAVGETLILEGNTNIQAIQLIRSGASDATVSITLEKDPTA